MLRSPGRAIEGATRAALELGFGHDFSGVRVHTGPQADQSARAMNALAYTAGHDIVFAAGQYAPGTSAGMRLLRHELTHVAQQRNPNGGATSERAAEQEAERNADLHGPAGSTQLSAKPGLIQRQTVPASSAMPLPAAGTPSKIDKTAQDIIDAAQDTKVDIATRAEAAVSSIIKAYHPGRGTNLTVTYDNKQAGTGLAMRTPLRSKATSSFATTLYVGDAFITSIDAKTFARKVLQVGHELEHLEQYRSGMVGPLIKGSGVDTLKDEREFRAFFHEALGPEAAHTGRVSHSNRINLVDGALGYYNCLDAAQQKAYSTNQQHLLDRRKAEIDDMTKKGFKDVPTDPPPTACKRQ